MRNLTNSQIKTLVDIFVGVGIVAFGSVVIPVAFNLGSIIMIVYGFAISLAFWYIAIVLSKNI